MRKILFLLLAATMVAGCDQSDKWSMHSPDGTISAVLEISEKGQLSYSMFINTDSGYSMVVEPSMLGLEREDGSFSSGLAFLSHDTRKLSESYTLATGKQRSVSYTANEQTFTFINNQGKEMAVTFRVFNDGMGFRYHFPGKTEQLHTITREHTAFNLPEDGTCWSQPYDTITMYTPAYETYYVRSMPIGTTAPAGMNGWSFPLTFHVGKTWGLITESNLDGTYPAMHLQPDCAQGIYTIRFPEEEEAFGNFTNQPQSTLPWTTPWRVVIAGNSPATLIASTMVTDLADPSRIEDISWIKPGRAAWSWWSDSPSPQFVKEQNRFTDLAVEMGWEYNLIDANWNEMKDGHVRDAIAYALEQGIGPMLWYNSGGIHNIVTEAPRDKMWDPDVRAAELKMISDWGVRGVKVDFFQSDKQAIIRQYLGILEDAAAHKVMVNFHGCTLPRGWNRTWPNMVTLEAVRGGEVYKFGRAYPESAPWHNTVLPFTRNVVGPMDYTPVMFTDHTYPHLTTYAHELATSVVFESGIIHMADKVEAYLGLPEQAKQFLMDVPAAWDAVRFIDGYPGEFVILARKNGDTWYIAGLNGKNTSDSYTFTPGFLGEGIFVCSMIMDGATDDTFSFGKQTIGRDRELTVDVLPYGGFAGIITAMPGR